MQTFNLAAHCLAANAELRPNKTALILAGPDSEQRLTYRELDGAVRRLAAGFSVCSQGTETRSLNSR